MAKYTSKYKSLGFYVNGVHKQFSNGIYETTDKEEIAVLSRVADAVKVDEPQSPQAAEPKTEAKPATKVSTAPKAPARKASAK